MPIARSWPALLLLALLCAAALPAHADTPGVRAQFWNNVSSHAQPARAPDWDGVLSDMSYAGSASPAPGISSAPFFAVYSGTILVPTSGAYVFNVYYDDSIRFSFDCNGDGSFSAAEVLRYHIGYQWADMACPSALVGGQRYKFRYEMFNGGGAGAAYLRWRGPAPVGGTDTLIPTGNGTMGFYSGIEDTTAPTLVATAVPCGANSMFWLTFSKPVDPTTAQVPANYTLSGGYSVTAAVLSDDRRSVALVVSPALSSQPTLSVSNVRDTAAAPNTIAVGSTISVNFASAATVAGVSGRYHDQNATAGLFFTGSSATRTDATISFDWGQGAPGVGSAGSDNFSVRWTGLLQIPATGNYTLGMYSDDGNRLWVNGAKVIDDWSVHAGRHTTSSAAAFTAGGLVPITIEYFESGGAAQVSLTWTKPDGTFEAVPASALRSCAAAQPASYSVSAAASGSTCATTAVTVTALDASGAPLTGWTGRVLLRTSTNRGDWAAGTGPAPQGTLANGAADDGGATYAFAGADNGVLKATLAHTLAQDVYVTATDGAATGTTVAQGSSGAIAFRDNAFVFAEDTNNRIAGADVAVAGRAHDMTLTLIKKDPTSGSCGAATNYSGNRMLKLWRSDSGGSWTAPSLSAPALSLPAAQPFGPNANVGFNAGVASFNLVTTDIGRYALNALDDSGTYATGSVNGSSNVLTVRPLAVVVSGLMQGATTNPGGSAATDAVFASAGIDFQASVGAYRWSAGADGDDDGVLDAGATLAVATAGGPAPSFASSVTLGTVAASQTPAGGTLGTLSNGTVSAFTGGIATPTNLRYSEVGSFALATTGVVANFIGSGLSLDAAVFNASGARSARVGRFKPARFAVSAPVVTHRASAGCSPASTFTYLGEPFRLGWTLTAQNGAGATTANYTGAFAKLDLTAAANLNLAGIAGGTVFAPSGRVALGSVSGGWSNGVANMLLTATAQRASSADGPFDAAFGIAPVDSDGVAVAPLNLDTDIPANGSDRAQVANVALRHGRLRLVNAIGPQDRALALPVAVQSWTGSTFATNVQDSCTTLPTTALNFGNLRRGLTTADTAAVAPVTIAAGVGSLRLAPPSGGRSGTLDVALSLSGSAADASCLQPWAPGSGDAATAGAGLAHLRGNWCGGTFDKDPSARATFGRLHGVDSIVYRRENF